MILFLCDHSYVKDPAVNSFNLLTHDGEEGKIRDEAASCSVFLIWAWAVGGKASFMPKQAGYRLTPKDSGRYVVAETHYDNPTLQSGMRDSSGVRILLMNSAVLRPQEAGFFWVAASSGPEITIPNGRPSFTIPAVCPPECTQKLVLV